MNTMTALAQLQSILNETYSSEENGEFKIELKEGLSDDEIHLLAQQLPTRQLPAEIHELLRFSSGFKFPPFKEITFDGISLFDMEEFFPYSVKLTTDIFTNVWIVDVDLQGNWGNVFFISHDPAVIVKHSENLSQFIQHIHEFGKDKKLSNLDKIREKTVFDIWEQKDGLISLEHARQSDDLVLKEFASRLENNYVIADLRNKPNKSGFAWGKFGPSIQKTIRNGSNTLWGIERRKGILSKIFNR
ncbi:SMI1/KNR4 family protein [Gynurincola endophyticus]|jgi:hypothetical protein|uniref:hypothetical protein n=1 Tax=Gynurincola endophyticus TaxID=2479004 RepID=UPI0018F3B4FC|nr:hypothetical protein [Gynurincola endophyticus]